MTIPNAFISHQIYLQRLASKEAGDVAPFIQLMRNEIRSRVLEFGDDSRTKARLQTMLRDMEDALYGITGDWDDQLIADLKDLSIYESKWTTEALNKNVDANFTSPSPEQVWAAIRFEPMAISEKPNDFSKWLADWSPVEVSRLVQGVKLGFVQGQTTRDIVKQVVGAGGLIDVSERNAKTIVRTAVAHVSNVAREAVYDKNSDIVEGYEWVSTLDSRTSTICRSRDGHVYLMTDKFKPKPPAHPNCLFGDTIITTGSRVSNLFKRSYKGAVVYITTKSGRTLSITPNHQVMTVEGWVAAGDLNLGSKLICGNDSAIAFHHKENNVVAQFSDLFSAANVAVNPTSISASPSSPEDFHGDGSDGEIEIVLVDSLSWREIKSSLDKQAVNDNLPVALGADLSLPGGGSPNKFGMVGLSSTDCIMSGGSEIQSILCGGVSHSDIHSVTDTSYPDSSFSKDPFDWVLRGADSLSDISWGDSFGVEVDEVVNLIVGEADFCGHVYNLENEQNWYLANGIIAHNCRSTTIPKIDDSFDFLDVGAKRAAKGADGGTQVSADMTYYDFLKTQPAWFQDEALGPTRGKIFRNAGMTPDEFRQASVDGFGRPLTLKQMAAADQKVADYLYGGD